MLLLRLVLLAVLALSLQAAQSINLAGGGTYNVSGLTPTRTDSGVPFVAGAWVAVGILSDTVGYVKIRVNSTTSANINATLPDTAGTPGIYVKTNSAAARSIDIDFYAGTATITR